VELTRSNNTAVENESETAHLIDLSTGAARSGRQVQPASWLFELADDGTVIYSRPHIVETNNGSDALEGHNFFDETFGFEDIAEYRRHFRTSVKSNKAAANFIWRRSDAGKSIDTKVFMTRIYQTGASDPTGAVMMEIRGCDN
jgi:hypothetical protein